MLLAFKVKDNKKAVVIYAANRYTYYENSKTYV
mgnify:CR=1 FL=1|jgi:hypothetical protein